jgi:hypothetical protein
MKTPELIEDLRMLAPPEYGVWLTLGIGAVLVFAILFLVRRRRVRGQGLNSAAPANPEPWTVALAALERLLPLLTSEQSREYAIQSTGILRHYIEDRYALRAPKLTTEEFLETAKESVLLAEDHRASLRHFLELCDLLKFGRYRAGAAELETLHAAAVAFVIASRPAVAADHQTEVPK